MNPETVLDLWRSYQCAVAEAEPELRRALEMSAEGYSYQEIAEELGCGLRTVPRYVERLRARLRRQRAEDGRRPSSRRVN